MTFHELREECKRFTNALADPGIKKEYRIGLHLPNCPKYLIAYYAILSVREIVVNLNPMYTTDELKLLINISGLKSLVTFDMILPTIRPLITALINHPKAAELNLGKKLGLLCSGGAPIPTELINEVKDMEIYFYRRLWPFRIDITGRLQPCSGIEESRQRRYSLY